MPRKSLIVLTLGAAALGGILFYASQKPAAPAEDSARSSGAPRVRAQGGGGETLSAPTSEAPEPAVASEASQRTNADEIKLVGVAGVQGKLLPMREANDLEKSAVRDLVKMHVPTPENGETDDGSSAPPGYDPDSLTIKYGSMDVEQLQEAHASVRAILDWQSRGPFQDKLADTLPGEIRRGMEIELEWLEQTILYP